MGTEAWISNLVLHTLVDTGIIGLAIQMSLFALVAWRTWLAASGTAARPLEIGLKAMTLGFLVMVIAYQLTDGTWLAVFWVHLALWSTAPTVSARNNVAPPISAKATPRDLLPLASDQNQVAVDIASIVNRTVADLEAVIDARSRRVEDRRQDRIR